MYVRYTLHHICSFAVPAWEMVLHEKGGEYFSVNFRILTLPHIVTICKIVNTLRHAGPLLEKKSEHDVLA
jgi:hypothetical protein